MNKQLLPLAAAALLFAACSGNKSESKEAVEFFPVHSYLRSQVAHIDTSMYTLRKITRQNGRADTTFLHRDAFRKEAADFLSIPDIASDKLKDDYTESRLYDDLLKRAVFSYSPKDEDAEVLQQDVTIEPGASAEGDAVRTIFVNLLSEEDNRTIQKKMLWEVGRRFQIVTTTQQKGSPDENRTVEVWWAPLPSAE